MTGVVLKRGPSAAPRHGHANGHTSPSCRHVSAQSMMMNRDCFQTGPRRRYRPGAGSPRPSDVDMSCPLNVLMDLPIEELGDGIDLIVVTGARELHEFKHKVVEPNPSVWHSVLRRPQTGGYDPAKVPARCRSARGSAGTLHRQIWARSRSKRRGAWSVPRQ